MINQFMRTPPVVKNLLIINSLFFLAQTVLPMQTREWIIENLALFYWDSPFFRPYQVFTYMFLHGGFGHFFMNMFALWMFGRILEYDLGSKRFLTFYLVAAVGAALLHLGVTWIEVSKLHESVAAMGQTAYGSPAMQSLYARINTPTVGASGGIFGILLAFGLLHPNSIIMLLIPPIPMKAKYFVIIYGLIELVFGVANLDNIAHFAHLGGMLWGYLLLRWWKHKGQIYY